ncbi:MAG: GntR family transcriptional regulator [Acidobacteriaceae bacterium]
MPEPAKAVRFTLNPDSGLPLYLQIAHEFIYRIESGMLAQNDKLPGIRKLAAELGVSFLTVDKAYKWLRERGVVASIPGVGVRVQLTLAPSQDEIRQRQKIERLAQKMVQLSIKEGLDPVMVAQAAGHHARTHRAQASAPEIVFVECHPEYVDDYTNELKRALNEEQVTVRGLLLDDLKQQLKQGRVELSKSAHLSTTLYHFDFLQRAVAGEGIRVVALSHTLDREAVRLVSDLDPGQKLGVLLGPVDPAPGIIQTIEFYRNQGPGTIPFAVVTDQPAARRLVKSCEVLAYTASCHEYVRALGDKIPRTILVRFVPDQDAVNKIKLLLARKGQNGHR